MASFFYSPLMCHCWYCSKRIYIDTFTTVMRGLIHTWSVPDPYVIHIWSIDAWSIRDPYMIHTWSVRDRYMIHCTWSIQWSIPDPYLIDTWSIPDPYLIHTWSIQTYGTYGSFCSIHDSYMLYAKLHGVWGLNMILQICTSIENTLFSEYVWLPSG